MHRFSGVLLVDRRGWVLLQERDERPAIEPDKWSLVGGHLDEGEGFEAAAYRELEEETGIRLRPGELTMWREVQVFHEVYDSLDVMQVWVGTTDLTDADIVLGEGRQIVFVEPDRACALDLAASAAAVLPDFLESALYRGLVG
jgi:8-oxo-dGTP diphosphatase